MFCSLTGRQWPYLGSDSPTPTSWPQSSEGISLLYFITLDFLPQFLPLSFLPLHPPHPGVQVWQGLDKVRVRRCHPLSLSFSGSTSVNYFTKVIYGAKQFHRVEPFANYIFYFPCICSPSLLYVKWPLAWQRSNCFLSRAPINGGLLPCTLD